MSGRDGQWYHQDCGSDRDTLAKRRVVGSRGVSWVALGLGSECRFVHD